MKNKSIRSAFLAAAAAVLVIPAAQAGGLGGALGGTLGGSLGGSLGPSMGTLGGSGSADGYGQGQLGAPQWGRPIGRAHDAGDRLTQRGSNAAGSLHDRAAASRASASGVAAGTVNGAAQSTQAAKSEAESPAPAPTARPALDPSLGTDGALGGSAGAQTRRHEASIDAGGAGSTHADRSGADARFTPDASAKAGRKAPPAQSGTESTQTP